MRSWQMLLGLLSIVLVASAPAVAQQSRFSQDPYLLNPDRFTNTILFDDYLAPGGNFNELPQSAKDILIAHRIAQQQVEMAIQYLKAHKEQILAGQDSMWNEVYGEITAKKKVAVLASYPISGWGDIDADDYIIEQVDTEESPPSPPEPPHVSFISHLQSGDWIFVAERLPDGTLDEGYVRRVFDVTADEENDDQEIEIDPNGEPFPEDLEDAVIYRVLYFDERSDPTIYNNVVATFEAIWAALGGFDPNMPLTGQSSLAVNYNGQFTDFNTIYGLGDGLIPSMNPMTAFPLIPNGVLADRRFRQAGFSNSDSHYSLDRRYDIENQNMVDRNGNPVFFAGDLSQPIPLMWTQDNEFPLEFDTRLPVPGATDRDRAFFANRQMVFGGLDDHWNQYVGGAFLRLDEDGVPLIDHDGDFYDSELASETPLVEGTRRKRTPAGGVIQFDANGNPILEIAKKQESARPVTGSSASHGMRQWQLIVQSFAEHTSSTFLDPDSLTGDWFANRGVVGMSDMLGAGGTQDMHARDGGRFARFAGLVRINPGGGFNIEPFGKRAQSNFHPIVPLQ